jgi:hypothetical protein
MSRQNRRNRSGDIESLRRDRKVDLGNFHNDPYVKQMNWGGLIAAVISMIIGGIIVAAIPGFGGLAAVATVIGVGVVGFGVGRKVASSGFKRDVASMAGIFTRAEAIEYGVDAKNPGQLTEFVNKSSKSGQSKLNTEVTKQQATNAYAINDLADVSVKAEEASFVARKLSAFDKSQIKNHGRNESFEQIARDEFEMKNYVPGQDQEEEEEQEQEQGRGSNHNVINGLGGTKLYQARNHHVSEVMRSSAINTLRQMSPEDLEEVINEAKKPEAGRAQD